VSPLPEAPGRSDVYWNNYHLAPVRFRLTLAHVWLEADSDAKRKIQKPNNIMKSMARVHVIHWLLVLIPALPITVQAQFIYQTNNGTITISGYNGPDHDVTIPATINGLPVTSIRSYAFMGLTNVTSITTPSSVTNIGDSAFYGCSRMANAFIATGAIGQYAFEDCSSLTNIEMSSVASIGYGAFSGCTSLRSVSIPASVTRIESVFAGCINLTNVTIPSSVTNIAWAFSDCTSLANVTIPSSVTRMDGAFSGCISLASVNIPSGITSIGWDTFFACHSLTNLVIPNSVTSIRSFAFAGCIALRTVDIPDSVTNIDGESYSGCQSLTSITIGKGVMSIAGSSFMGCNSLTGIAVDPLNAAYSSVDGVLFNKSQTALITYPGARIGSYVIPTGVTYLYSEAFWGHRNLTGITIPNSLTQIAIYSFAGCTGLTTISFGTGLTNIGWKAFSGCTSLTRLTIPNSVISVDSEAFAECASLTNVTIGTSVGSIGYRAFSGCTSLSSVSIPASVTSIGAPFSDCTSLTAISVDPLNPALTSVDEVLFNKSQTRLIQYPGGMAGSYTVPNTVTVIGSAAFAGCRSLTGVAIPQGIGLIDSEAFSDCTSLTTMVIPNSVTEIGYYAFARCTSLLSVSIGNGVTALRNGMFSGCTALTSVTLPKNLESIDGYAFEDCTSLKSVTIPAGVTSIGTEGGLHMSGDGCNAAFAGCSNLTAVYFEGNAPGFVSCEFSGSPLGTLYFLPGTTNWSPNANGRPTALWLPTLSASQPGPPTDPFGFTISWARDRVIVVEAATDLNQPTWLPLSTNTLVSGSATFNDLQWTHCPMRVYRVRTP